MPVKEFVYYKTTNNVKVAVYPTYNQAISNPKDFLYSWDYNVHITNLNDYPVKLLSRFWQIISNTGQLEEVSGEGVVGVQPIIQPKETYEYTSGVSLKTESGFMLGKYFLVNSNTLKEFTIEIPCFALESDNPKLTILN